MELKVKNKLLSTRQVHGETFTDEAMEQLHKQLVDTAVYVDYSEPFVGPITEYYEGVIEQTTTYGKWPVGYVKDVRDNQIIVVIDADKMPLDMDTRTMIAKLDLLIEPAISEDESIVVIRVLKVLGVYLVHDEESNL